MVTQLNTLFCQCNSVVRNSFFVLLFTEMPGLQLFGGTSTPVMYKA